MTEKMARIIVWKQHDFDGYLKDWFFAKTKEDIIKARKSYYSVRGVGDNLKGIMKQLETAKAKDFYTIKNETTGEITYHAVCPQLTLRHYMINNFDLSCEYTPLEGYHKADAFEDKKTKNQKEN